MVSTDNICGIIFFRDPLSAHPHHADIEALGRLCDVYQVPFATNPGTAEAILKYLRSGDVHVSVANQVLDNYRRGQKKVLSSPLSSPVWHFLICFIVIASSCPLFIRNFHL